MSRETYEEAIEFFVSTVAQVPADSWSEPALGVWNVRDLAGHASRAMLTVEQYVTEGTTRVGFGTADDIAERGREWGRQLGKDPIGAVREIAKRVLELVRSLPDAHPLETPAGQIPLMRYLPTRVTELTIHTMDLADALGIAVEPPAECLRETLYCLAGYAVRRSVAVEVALGLTGRQALSPGFSVVS